MYFLFVYEKVFTIKRSIKCFEKVTSQYLKDWFIIIWMKKIKISATIILSYLYLKIVRKLLQVRIIGPYI